MARIEQDELGELLSAYIDGELSAGETTFVEKLLREDATARELLEELRRTVETTVSLPRHSAPASLVGDVQAMLERTALLDGVPSASIHAHRDRAPWAARLSLAAMVMLLVAGGWYFLQEPGRRGTTLPGTPIATRENGASKPAESASKETALTQPPPAPVAVDRRTVDEKLSAGVELVALRGHAFEAETVRLQLSVPDAKGADALAERVTRKLADEKLVNLASRPSDAAASKGFYYRGDAGKNFLASNESQILVRATPTQIEQVLGDVAKAGQPDESATLVAGTLNVPGLQNSQVLLNTVAQSQGARRQNSAAAPIQVAGAEGKDRPSYDFVGELIKIVGMDKAMLSKKLEESAKLDASAAMADSAKSKSDFEEDQRGRSEGAARAKGSLVDRNLAKLESRSTSPPDDEPLVTMIIQLVAPPAPSPKPASPSGRAQENPPIRGGSGRSTS